MREGTAKVCIVGDFAVGKTSLVERCVNNEFSEKYLTTVGVKIDTKVLELEAGRQLKMVIWDVAGTDRFGEREFAYLRGSAGLILVADGTRSHTVDTVERLREEVTARYGELPFVALVNKSDLADSWEFDDDRPQAPNASRINWMSCSAKTGAGVEAAFITLAGLLD